MKPSRSNGCASGSPSDEAWDAGWIPRDRLLRLLGTTPEALNVDIHRARRQFASIGLKDAANIIERRREAAEIRLGTSCVAIYEQKSSNHIYCFEEGE